MIRDTVLVSLHGQVAINTMESLTKMKDTDMEKCIGVTAAVTRASGLKEYSTGMEG